MIIWGWSTKKIGSRKIEGSCMACQSNNLMLVGYIRVFDLFWIPVFPYKKFTYVECTACSATYSYEKYIALLPTQNVRFKTPWWSFSGLVIISALLIWSHFHKLEENKKFLAFQESPHAGVYFIYKSNNPELKKTPYIFAKIEEIKGDKLMIRFSQSAYNKERFASKEARYAKNEPQKFLEVELVEITKDDLKKFTIEDLVL